MDDHNEAAFWNNKGNELFQLGRYEEALATYEKAIRLDPNNAGVWNSKGQTLFKVGRVEEALATCEEAIRLKPKDVDLRIDKVTILCHLGRPKDALAALDKAIRLKPNDPSLWHNKGTILCGVGRFAEALVACDEAIQLKPNAVTWNCKGNALRMLGRSEEALTALEEAIRLNRNLAGIWYGKGSILNDLGRFEEALTAFEEAIQIQLSPELAFLFWNGKGVALCKLARFEEALTAFKEAIRLDPKFAAAWNSKGNALNDLGLFEEALTALEKAIQLNSNFAQPWMNKANLLRANKELQEDRIDRDPEHCLCRAAFLAWPPRSVEDSQVLGSVVLQMAEDGGMALLLERLVRTILPEGGLLTVETVLRHAKEDTEVARSVFAWLEEPGCPLRLIENLRLRGQIFLRFGDPIMAYQVLNELNRTEEGKRDLGGQLYLVWSLEEYLEPHEEELDFAHSQAKKWMQGEWGSMDEMTCYYAGHIALLKGDLAMARSAFDLAGVEPAALLMGWHTAHLAKDVQTAAEHLDLLLEAERECLLAGQTGILFSDTLHPFDPNTTEGQNELQLVLRWFEVSGALMDLLETINLYKHPGYQKLNEEFKERTGVFVDFERYKHAVRTWKLKEEVQQKLENDQANVNRHAAEKEMQERASDFKMLGVLLPCELRGRDLEERVAQGLVSCDLSGHRDATINAILLMFRLDWLKAEQAVLLTMYAHAKGYHDQAVAREVRLEKFVARTGFEVAIFYLLSHCGVGFVIYIMARIGGWGLARKIVDSIQAVVGNLQADGKTFPTYPEFKKHLHRYWSESGNPEELRFIFGQVGDDSLSGIT